ncbi:MAG: flagellar basal body P-ring formation protein FlgA [Alphaproteobacteria bacterium]|nr:flagellar basal body P-ring formation protein FlgA [Alphaproteobacteria bacterium]
MRKLAAAIAIGIAPLLILAATPAAASTPILVNRAVVHGDMVKLGDLFRNIGDKAPVEVDVAPAPGQTATYHAVQLANIARAHGLDWKPHNQFDRVAVERASKMVPRDVIDQAIIKALAQQGAPTEVEVEIQNWQFRMFVPVEKPYNVALESVVYDNQNKRFSGTISAPAGDPNAERAQIYGRIYLVVEVPVLRRRVNPGEQIKREDIDFMKVRDYQALRGIIVSPGALIGFTPRRALNDHTVLRDSDIQPLLLVSRNETVTVTLNTSSMSLSTQGKALDNGAKGETVRVLNTKSNKTVEGIVTGPNTVAVKAPTRVAVN